MPWERKSAGARIETEDVCPARFLPPSLTVTRSQRLIAFRLKSVSSVVGLAPTTSTLCIGLARVFAFTLKKLGRVSSGLRKIPGFTTHGSSPSAVATSRCGRPSLAHVLGVPVPPR